MPKHTKTHVRFFVNYYDKRDPRVWVVSTSTEEWETVHRANLLAQGITVKVIAKPAAMRRANRELVPILPKKQQPKLTHAT